MTTEHRTLVTPDNHILLTISGWKRIKKERGSTGRGVLYQRQSGKGLCLFEGMEETRVVLLNREQISGIQSYINAFDLYRFIIIPPYRQSFPNKSALEKYIISPTVALQQLDDAFCACIEQPYNVPDTTKPSVLQYCLNKIQHVTTNNILEMIRNAQPAIPAGTDTELPLNSYYYLLQQTARTPKNLMLASTLFVFLVRTQHMDRQTHPLVPLIVEIRRAIKCEATDRAESHRPPPAQHPAVRKEQATP